MNKFIRTTRVILITLALLGATLPVLTLAADAPPPASGSPGSSSSSDNSLNAIATPDELFYQFTYKNADTSKTNIGAVNAIATTNSWQVVLANVVKNLLNISGGLALIALTAGGVMFVTARGKSDQVEKGKKIVIYSIIGLIIIAVSYAIVIGVSSLQFFTPGAGGGATGGSAAPAGAPAAPAPGSASAPGGTSSNTGG